MILEEHLIKPPSCDKRTGTCYPFLHGFDAQKEDYQPANLSGYQAKPIIQTKHL